MSCQPGVTTSAGFDSAELEDSTKGRRTYLERLENLIDWSQPDSAGRILRKGQSLQSTLKRGWYFGTQDFREKLLAL